MPHSKAKTASKEPTKRINACPGSFKRPDTTTLKRTTRRDAVGYSYPVHKYLCAECGKYYTLRWQDGTFSEHGYTTRPLTKIEKKKLDIQKLVKAGKLYSLCAECEGPVFDYDYLCTECRK